MAAAGGAVATATAGRAGQSRRGFLEPRLARPMGRAALHGGGGGSGALSEPGFALPAGRSLRGEGRAVVATKCVSWV